MYLTTTLVIIAISSFILKLYLRQKKFLEEVKDIPGPETLPLIGNTFDVGGPDVILQKLLKLKEKYGEIYRLILPGDIRIVVSGQKYFEYFLTANHTINKSASYKFFHNWLGRGIFTAEGEKWRRVRKILTPAFHFKILATFLEVFEKSGNILVENLKEEVDKDSTDIKNQLALCTLAVIHDLMCKINIPYFDFTFLETAMGTNDYHYQTSKSSKFVQAINDLAATVITRMFNPLYQIELLYKFTSIYRKEKIALEKVHSHTAKIIESKKEELRARKRQDSEREMREYGIKKKKAFLDMLLQFKLNGKAFSDKEIEQEVNTFMFGGYDTTLTTLHFLCYNLSNHIDVQNKIVAELREIFAEDKFRNATNEDIQKMKYLEMAIKESLRIYTTAPFFGRQLEEDHVVNGYKLPKGAVLNFLIHGLHMDPRYFPEPEKYDPERHAPENSKKILNFTYLPFSAGARNCIGQKFAMLEMKSIMSKLLRHYEFLPTEPKHEIQISTAAVLSSKTGIRIRIKKREF